MIHIPDKTGIGDTAADPTVREKELVGQSATTVPTHLKPPASVPGLEGNFFPKTLAL